MVLCHAALWQELGAAEQDLLTHLDSWHAALFQWLDRDITEHGPREWPALREALAEQTFGARAQSLVDDAALPSSADLVELRGAVAQTARARALREPLALLGRLA
jgi:hypothetical protein